ncbi:MAG: alanine--glyoxylate aminotransferase family protein [Isosphaeraceae bacterium]
MRKPRLMTPGPAPVPEDVLLELARPLNHHRSDGAKQVLAEVQDGLKMAFQTSNDVLILTSSGTGAMEAALVNAVPPGRSVLVLDAGHFADRWARIAETFGIEAIRLEVPWGEAVDPTQVAEALERHPDVAAALRDVVRDIHRHGPPDRGDRPGPGRQGAPVPGRRHFGRGAIECRTDAWGIDLLCVGSQKALMLPPGLAFVAVSPRGWGRIDSFESRSFYFNLKAARAALGRSDTPWTPAHPMILALRTSLQRIEDEGIEKIWGRHRRMGMACRAGVQALGLELFSRSPADAMTVFHIPGGLRDAEIRGMLDERFGITLVGGQGRLQGRVLRVGHLGYMDGSTSSPVCRPLEQVLQDLGYGIEPGAAVAAAQRVLLGSGGKEA